MDIDYTPQDKIKRAVSFGKWAVSINGDMEYDSYYSITAFRLKEDNWIAHLFEKNWIDFNEFIPAYFQACKNAGIQYVKIMIYYP